MKAKYLVDECVTSKFDLSLGTKDSKYVNSVTALGYGATDRELYKYAKARNMTVITADRGFVDFLLRKNQSVIRRYEDGDLLIKPKLQKILDPLTDYLLKNNEVLLR